MSINTKALLIFKKFEQNIGALNLAGETRNSLGLFELFVHKLVLAC